jgi:hypothetical protein
LRGIEHVESVKQCRLVSAKSHGRTNSLRPNKHIWAVSAIFQTQEGITPDGNALLGQGPNQGAPAFKHHALSFKHGRTIDGNGYIRCGAAHVQQKTAAGAALRPLGKRAHDAGRWAG